MLKKKILYKWNRGMWEADNELGKVLVRLMAVVTERKLALR